MAECSLGVNDGKLYFVVVIPRGFLASSCFRNIYFFVVCNFIVFVSSSDADEKEAASQPPPPPAPAPFVIFCDTDGGAAQQGIFTISFPK